MRYNTDGSLDTSFGTNGSGQVITLLSPTARGECRGDPTRRKNRGCGRHLHLQSRELRPARYNPNGTLDTSFGNGGVVTTYFAVPTSKKTTNYSNAAIASLVIQPDGRIVVAGNAQFIINGSSSEDVALARYNTNGTLDTTFGKGGTVATSLGTTFEVRTPSACKPSTE